MILCILSGGSEDRGLSDEDRSKDSSLPLYKTPCK